MKSQKLYSYVRKAVDDFGMIEDGDKIAILNLAGSKGLLIFLQIFGLVIDNRIKKEYSVLEQEQYTRG